ncbi:MAG: site-2 protease family protein, partial [Solirubrobacterales bacterium]
MPTGGGTFTLFRYRGIRVSVDWTWFIVLFLVIFWLGDSYRAVLGGGAGSIEPFLFAVASAIGFFGSILLHEFGHAIVALRNGIGITSIRLWIFGGVAEMDRESDSPGTEFKVAVAGPVVTAVLAVLFALVGIAVSGPGDFQEGLILRGGPGVDGVTAMLGWHPNEWIGHPFEEFCHPDDIDWGHQRRDAINAGATSSTRLRFRDRAGQWHWVEVHAGPYRNPEGEQVGLAGSMR